MQFRDYEDWFPKWELLHVLALIHSSPQSIFRNPISKFKYWTKKEQCPIFVSSFYLFQLVNYVYVCYSFIPCCNMRVNRRGYLKTRIRIWSKNVALLVKVICNFITNWVSVNGLFTVKHEWLIWKACFYSSFPSLFYETQKQGQVNSMVRLENWLKWQILEALMGQNWIKRL